MNTDGKNDITEAYHAFQNCPHVSYRPVSSHYRHYEQQRTVCIAAPKCIVMPPGL